MLFQQPESCNGLGVGLALKCRH